MGELYRVRLGRYSLKRRDILVLEEIFRDFADTYETLEASKYGKQVQLSKTRKRAPRVYADMHVEFNGVRADSVKYLPKSITKSRYFSIKCSPSVWITFTPFSATIGAQQLYATGEELDAIYKLVAAVKNYLYQCDKAIVNVWKLK